MLLPPPPVHRCSAPVPLDVPTPALVAKSQGRGTRTGTERTTPKVLSTKGKEPQAKVMTSRHQNPFADLSIDAESAGAMHLTPLLEDVATTK